MRSLRSMRRRVVACAPRNDDWTSRHGNAEIFPEPVLQIDAIARRQRAIDVVGRDADQRQPRSAFPAMDLATERGNAGHVRDLDRRLKARAARDLVKPRAEAGM